MRISRVAYGFTKNLGNYQSLRVDATVELSEDDSPDEALELAVAFVHEALGDDLDDAQKHILGDERRRVSAARS